MMMQSHELCDSSWNSSEDETVDCWPLWTRHDAHGQPSGPTHLIYLHPKSGNDADRKRVVAAVCLAGLDFRCTIYTALQLNGAFEVAQDLIAVEMS